MYSPVRVYTNLYDSVALCKLGPVHITVVTLGKHNGKRYHNHDVDAETILDREIAGRVAGFLYIEPSMGLWSLSRGSGQI